MILDVAMPEITGLELVPMLRKQGHKFPILMLSANAQLPSSDEKINIGYDEYLVKPIQNTQLIERIGFYLKLEWRYKELQLVENVGASASKILLPGDARWLSLNSSIEIGYKKGVVAALREFSQTGHLNNQEFDRLMTFADRMQFNELLAQVTIEESV
jgi:DNA-binding response OmpR family regulator